MSSRLERLEAKKAEVLRLMAENPTPATGVVVKRRVRIRQNKLLEVRSRVTIPRPPLGGGAAEESHLMPF